MNETEPSFTRVARPSTNTSSYDAFPDTSDSSDRLDTSSQSWMSPSPVIFPIGFGWAIACGVGVWLFMRWRRDRNKPINRLRRQADVARRAAAQMRDRMPEIPEEATRPAMGLGTVLLSLAVFLWQQSQSRSRTQQMTRRMDKASHKARKTVADMDWQDRLLQLRDLWNPSRVELEKISIPKR